MLQTVTLKLTPAELKLLDWLASYRLCHTRSAALRDALYCHALLHDAPEELQKNARKQRAQVPDTTRKPTVKPMPAPPEPKRPGPPGKADGKKRGGASPRKKVKAKGA